MFSCLWRRVFSIHWFFQRLASTVSRCSLGLFFFFLCVHPSPVLVSYLFSFRFRFFFFHHFYLLIRIGSYTRLRRWRRWSAKMAAGGTPQQHQTCHPQPTPQVREFFATTACYRCFVFVVMIVTVYVRKHDISDNMSCSSLYTLYRFR